MRHDRVGERAGSRAFERVSIRRLGEDSARAPVDVFRDVDEHGVTRGACEDPIQHLATSDEVSRVRLGVGVEFIFPSHDERILPADDVVHRTATLRVHVRVHPSVFQDD